MSFILFLLLPQLFNHDGLWSNSNRTSRFLLKMKGALCFMKKTLMKINTGFYLTFQKPWSRNINTLGLNWYFSPWGYVSNPWNIKLVILGYFYKPRQVKNCQLWILLLWLKLTFLWFLLLKLKWAIVQPQIPYLLFWEGLKKP